MNDLNDPPVTRYQLEREANDKCPRCRGRTGTGGELDTGYECNFCGYDAGWLSAYVPAFLAAKAKGGGDE